MLMRRSPTQEPDITAKWQNISPPDSLWTLYEEIEGELAAAAQYTRTEIREYIKDLQSHYKPKPAESSTKDPPIPEISTHRGVDMTSSSDPDSDTIVYAIRGERQANKLDTESPMSSCKSDPTCSDRSCGREESTPNRMAPVQMRIPRAQPKRLLETQPPTVT
jgi:hypothetical protein